MCLNPKRIYTKSKFVDVSSLGSSLAITVNCGVCYECQKMKRNEYYARIKAQIQDVQSKGGFAFWDCLSYDQNHVPCFTVGLGLQRGNINYKDGYSLLCFNTQDYRDFFKRLRNNLKRNGFSDKLKYYFVSEYGGKTHRPHYHCVYFVEDSRLTPRWFDWLIRKSWTFGINDKYNKDGTRKRPEDKVINGDGAIMYVAKYVIKDDEYVKVINEFAEEHNLTSDVIKELMPFHRQSQGFGKYIIDSNDLDYVKRSGNIIINTPSGKYSQTLPKYIERKLYFDNVKRADGSRQWIPTEKGLDYLETVYTRKIDNCYKRIVDTVALAPKLDLPALSFDPIAKYHSLMNGRDPRLLATFIVFYQGRILPVGFNPDNPPTVRECIKSMYDFKQKDFSRSRKKRYYKASFIYEKDYDHNYVSLDGKQKISLSTFVDKFSTCDADYPMFSGFGYAMDLINFFSYVNSLKGSEDADRIQKIQNRLKKLFQKNAW